MKTSNYIFLSYLIFLFSGILLLFIGAKYYERVDNVDNFLSQEKPLDTFSVVVAEAGSNFVLKTGAQNKISQRYLKELVPNFAPFAVRNDTLFVYAIKKYQQNIQEQSKGGSFIIVPEIFCKIVKSIVVKEKSEVRLNEFHADSLSINLNKAQLNANFKKITSVFIQAKDSDIYLEGEYLENLSMKLDKTKLNVPLQNRIFSLSGSLKNNSKADITLSSIINLNVDKTSTYAFYNIVD